MISMIEKECGICGKKMNVFPYQLRTGKGKYCSRECAFKALHKNKGRKMSEEKRKIFAEKIRNNKVRSKKLSDSLKKYFAEHPNARKKISLFMKIRPHSEKQREAARKIGFKNKGENNGQWKGGHIPERKKVEHTLAHKKFRIAIFKRDNYTCQMCGAKRKKGDRIILNAHHIRPFSLFPELRHEISNGLTLCSKCHYKIHRGKNHNLARN